MKRAQELFQSMRLNTSKDGGGWPNSLGAKSNSWYFCLGKSLDGKFQIYFLASKLLEKLYKTEIIEKEKTEESVRQQVSELLHQMRQEQKEKLAKSRVCERMSCEDSKNIVYICKYPT